MSQSDGFDVNNGTPLDEQLGYIAHSVVVSNFTSAWLYVDAAGLYVPPGGGVGARIADGTQKATITWRTPSGKTPGPLIPAEIARVEFSEDQAPASSGITSQITTNSTPGTSVNLAQVGGIGVAAGQAAMANSLPVAVASDQSSIPTAVGRFDSLQAAGAVLNPGAGAAIATIAAPGAGAYEVQIVTFVTGIQGAQNNMELRHGGTTVKASGLSSVLGVPVQVIQRRLTVGAAEAISINATAADAGGVTYVAAIIATRL